MMPEDSDQLTDDELWASFGDSLDVLQDLPAALELLQKELSDVIQEMSVAAVPEAEPWLHRLCRICNEQPPEAPFPAEEQPQSLPAADPQPAVAASDTTVISQPRAENGGSPTQTGDTDFLSVGKQQLETLTSDVSNLFITHERLKGLYEQIAGSMRSTALDDELRRTNTTFSAQATALQKSVVSIRQVPVSQLFSQLRLVAQSAASEHGKQLIVHVSGEDLEIDRSLADDLQFPVTQLVHNACEHGIEAPTERRDRGVPEVGNLWLSCELIHGHIILTVKDDGRGINSRRLRDLSVEVGSLTRDQAAALSDDDAMALVFDAGISTAQQGLQSPERGAGLAEARARMGQHDGNIQVSSVATGGTAVRVELPQRNAIDVVHGLLLRQNDESFMVPFEFIQEIFELEDSQLSNILGQQAANIRGEVFAAVSLAELLQGVSRNSLAQKPNQGILVSCRNGAVCLLVDEVVGQRKVILNRLDEILNGNPFVDGVAQLGGGELALVLNASELVSNKTRRQSAGDS
jgi:two-component system, chemotaxis family, sensor kinase CheA